MLIGILGCAGGLAGVIASDGFVVELVGILLTYAGLMFAFAGHEKWQERRQPLRHASRCLPRLEAVLDRGTVTVSDEGAVAGRFRNHQIEVTGTDEQYQVRVLLAGAGGLPWVT